MKLRLPLLAGVLLVAGLLLAGASLAVPADEAGNPIDTLGDGESSGEVIEQADKPGEDDRDSADEGEEIDGIGGGEAGICVIGVDSECNADEWKDETEIGDAIGEEDSAGGNDVGICVIGVDSPCNDERWGSDAGDELTATVPDPVNWFWAMVEVVLSRSL